MKQDYWRYLIIYEKGGCYADADSCPAYVMRENNNLFTTLLFGLPNTQYNLLLKK